MTKIKLYGFLGEKFGRDHSFEIATPAEALRALKANFPEFVQLAADHPGGLHVMVDYETRTLVGLTQPMSSMEIVRIVPSVSGAGIEAGLIAVFTALGASAAVAATLASIAVSLLTSLIISGITSILFKPKKSDISGSELAANQPSDVFNGAVNTTVQGHGVSIGYGRMVIGSQVVSAGVSVEQIPV